MERLGLGALVFTTLCREIPSLKFEGYSLVETSFWLPATPAVGTYCVETQFQ